MLNIGVMVSGGGTNLQALIDSEFDGKIVTVVSSNPKAYALERAKKASIPTKVIPKQPGFTKLITEHMKECKVDLIIMAGYLLEVEPILIQEFRDRIINVHPSLIPSFSGRGYYSMKVHEGALKYGVKVTGATVHFVSENLDEGAIIFQKAVEVQDDDTPETLQARVMKEAEHILLPRAVKLFCEGKLVKEGRKVTVKE